MIKYIDPKSTEQLYTAVQELNNYIERSDSMKFIHTLVLKSLIDEVKNEYNNLLRSEESEQAIAPDLTNKQIREYFNGICPYTSKLCDDFDCHKCAIEQGAREYLEEGYYDRT